MKPKMVKVGDVEYIEARNGKPVYVDDAGAEVEGDLPHAVNKIKELSEERGRLQTENATLKQSAEALKGIDPEKARKALETVANLDAGKLLEAGKVDEIKAQVNAAWEAKLGEATATNAKEKQEIQDRLTRHMRRSAFGSSTYREQLQDGLRPVDIMERVFGDYFTPEGDTLVAVVNGEKLRSKKKPGDYADVDEALELIVNSRADKANLLKGSPMNGSGAGPSAGRPGTAVVLSEAEAKDPARYRAAKEAAAKAGQPLQIGA